jgi:hypothetical protein
LPGNAAQQAHVTHFELRTFKHASQREQHALNGRGVGKAVNRKRLA